MEEKSTKDRILDAAEQLFAKQGFAATSLRNVIKTAGVNTAAVHYHFGSKDGLVEAVLIRRATPVNAERLRLLDRLEEAFVQDPLPLKDVVEAFIGPVVKAKLDIASGPDLLRRLFGRAATEADAEVREMMHRIFGDVLARFTAAFTRALPDLPLEELHWRMHFMIGALVFGMAVRGVHRASEEKPEDSLDLDILISRLVAFASAGMRGNADPAE